MPQPEPAPGDFREEQRHQTGGVDEEGALAPGVQAAEERDCSLVPVGLRDDGVMDKDAIFYSKEERVEIEKL